MEDLIWEAVLNVGHGRDASREFESLSRYWNSPEAKLKRQAEALALSHWFHGMSFYTLNMSESNHVIASKVETRHISRHFMKPRISPTPSPYGLLGPEDTKNDHTDRPLSFCTTSLPGKSQRKDLFVEGYPINCVQATLPMNTTVNRQEMQKVPVRNIIVLGPVFMLIAVNCADSRTYFFTPLRNVSVRH